MAPKHHVAFLVLSTVLLALSACLLAVTTRLISRIPSAQAVTQGITAAPEVSPSSSAGPGGPDVCRVGAWLQTPDNAAAWKNLGVQCLVGQWDPVTEQTLTKLRSAGMPFMSESQSDFSPGKTPPSADGLLLAWLTSHEPDLSQDGSGGPATPPEEVIAEAEAIKKADPTRPVLVFFSLGVAVPAWYGMGADSARWEDYYKQIVTNPSVDQIAFDLYPWNSDPLLTGNGQVQPTPQLVVDGLRRLKEWSGDKPVFVTLAASQVSEKFPIPGRAQTLELVSSVLDNGADGIIWFGHDFTAEGQYIRDAHPLQVSDDSAETVRMANQLVTDRLGLEQTRR